MERWNDSAWTQVVVKLKSGEEISYARNQLWGLFYDYGSASPSSQSSPGRANPGLAVPARPAPPQRPQRWEIRVAGIVGTLEFSRQGQTWVGRANIDGHWEDLSRVSFTTSPPRVTFSRPSVNQDYIGETWEGRMKGKFTQDGQPAGDWAAYAR
jgi:hypothetical protein